MNFALQLLVAGLAIGSVYSLIALGIVLIYKCSGVVNFGQGGFLVLGAYLTYALKAADLPTPLAVGGSVLGMAFLGMAVERLMLRPMTRAPLVAVMMATLGLMITINAVCLAVWGSDQRAYPKLFPDGGVNVFEIFITYNYLAAGGLAICLSLGFLAFYRFTNVGLRQRCTANNPKAALAIGIHIGDQNRLAWSMSASLAGLGGTLLATLNGLSPNLGDIGLAAFPVVVLGGLNSLAGALLAGLLLGVLQTFTAGMLTPVLETSCAPIRVCTPSAPCSRSCPFSARRHPSCSPAGNFRTQRNGTTVMVRFLSPNMLAALLAIATLLVIPSLDRYTTYLLVAVAIAAVGALALNVITGMCGLISFSHGALLGVGAYTAGNLGNAGWDVSGASSCRVCHRNCRVW